MDALWAVVTFAFTFGTLALVAFGLFRTFGGGRHVH